jgi:hypothetical protein
MAKIWICYTTTDGDSQYEDYLNAGEAYDRADFLLEIHGIDSTTHSLEYNDGEGFVSETIKFVSYEEHWEAHIDQQPLWTGFGATPREAIIELLDSANESEKLYAMKIGEHKRWYNDRRQAYFEIVGVVRSCEAANWELLYKREGETIDPEYFRRPAWEWQQLNRDGVPRFVKA